ncbi:Sodium/potassium-transporting ATPase subunit beta [Sarcoptes scabiei]|uniref:Sodium/potassium-transporting ATPase subunit beta n=1 Tax=Sarcoptes scabiei TaxID=52283 RepID=A0A834R5D8_SARSC|nr:Sodium/potassium-transporting ATPase subunit beta [Sarcoptes scabiei]UXI20361.1 hypothetical protein NH340_JMT06304 [Sarcoptes scabiei]
MANKEDKYSEKSSGWQKFCKFVWNSDTNQFLGRTGGSWFKIIVFYIIFYLCLAAFWALMLLIFYQTIDYRTPKYQLEDSRIGSNPGLGFRPRPKDENIDSTLIWFKNGNNEKNWKYWSDSLKDFVDNYRKSTPDAGAHMETCGENQMASEGKFCHFDVNNIPSQCSAENHFGYQRGDPCVLIKLNKIFNWKPEPFSEEDLKDPNIPDVVRNSYSSRNNASQLIYVTCEGENAADKENVGEIEYYPKPGIEFKYYPYTNQPGYLSPFVFAHFKKPTPGVLINIECKAWAKNIKHNRMDREGSVHFELLVDGF